MSSRILSTFFACFLVLAASAVQAQVRVKDIARVSGERMGRLVGYGLVVGLPGTGDTGDAMPAVQSMANMLQQMGVAVDPAKLKPGHAAAVLVTARMPDPSRSGRPLDVAVTALSDAPSLAGGTLLPTMLQDLQGRIFAQAQGQMGAGGVSAGGRGARATANQPATARIPGGGRFTRGVPFGFSQLDTVGVNLDVQSFDTANAVARAVNLNLGGNYAKALNAAYVEVIIPPKYASDPIRFLAQIESLPVSVPASGKIVLDPDTGTVVLGQRTRLRQSAVAHGDLVIIVSGGAKVSQPPPFAFRGQTVVVPNSRIRVMEGGKRVQLMEGATVEELVQALNEMNATPRDVIQILKTLKASGGLSGDVVAE